MLKKGWKMDARGNPIASIVKEKLFRSSESRSVVESRENAAGCTQQQTEKIV